MDNAQQRSEQRPIDPITPRPVRPVTLKRVVIAIGALAVVVAAAVAFIVLYQPDAVRQYVRRQVEAIAAAHLHPELKFDDFKYIYPGTVEIYNARLLADAPELPKRKLVILGADVITLTLAEVPKIGRPIVIERIAFDKPVLQLITDQPGGTEFYGFSKLVRDDDETPPAVRDEPVKLSDVFKLRHIVLTDGHIVYDTRADDAGPMVLDGVNTELRLSDDDDAGWHTLDLSFAREPVVALDGDGRINLDTMMLELAELTLDATVSREFDRTLPPQLQTLLRRYDVKGELAITLSGAVNLNDPEAGDVKLNANLTGAQMVIDKYIVPIDRLAASVTVAERVMRLDGLSLDALGGRTTGNGQMALAGDRAARFTIEFDGPRLERTLVADEFGEQALPYAGRLDGQVRIEGPLAKFTTHAGGGGELRLTEARLVKLPIAQDVAEAGREALALQTADEPTHNHTARIDFVLAGDRVNITDMQARTGAIAVRGKGDVYFNSTLDLRLNGGPIEKVQSMLGAAGRILGAVTDALIAYKITGTLDEPKVRVKVLGIGASPDNDPFAEGASMAPSLDERAAAAPRLAAEDTPTEGDTTDTAKEAIQTVAD